MHVCRAEDVSTAAAAAAAGKRLRGPRQQKGHEPAEGDGCAGAAAAMVGSLHHHDHHGPVGSSAHVMPSADPLLEAAAGGAVEGATRVPHQADDGPTLLLHQQLSAAAPRHGMLQPEGVAGAVARQQQQVTGAVTGGGGSSSRNRSSGYLRATDVMATVQVGCNSGSVGQQ